MKRGTLHEALKVGRERVPVPLVPTSILNSVHKISLDAFKVLNIIDSKYTWKDKSNNSSMFFNQLLVIEINFRNVTCLNFIINLAPTITRKMS